MRRWFLPVYRAAVFGLIVWLIHDQHRFHLGRPAVDAIPFRLDVVREFFPSAARLRTDRALPGGRVVETAEGERLGYVIQTSPASDTVVGFSGPSNTLLAFGSDDRIISLRILGSGDTKEHLEKVVDDPNFLTAFSGLTWQDVQSRRDFDAVSGATLTSMAVVEGIVRRLGGKSPSLRFPDEITSDETWPWFPGAARLEPVPDRPAIERVLDVNGDVLGTVTRTAPAADNEIGYQGPTDMLIALDPDGRRIKGLGLRKSFDNQPYVRYVDEDEYFRALFQGKTLPDLAQLDLEASGVEGVSGATMTSLAIARGLVRAAQVLAADSVAKHRTVSFRQRDVGTIVMLGFGMAMAFTRLRGKRAIRIGFQLALVGYLGFVNGDMVSQALLAGWSKNGLPWARAPGLLCLTFAALLAPLATQRQLYCHHICPHGAAQQLLKGLSRWRLRIPHPILRGLELLPATLLLWVVLVAMLHLPVSLVSIEPFDAYIFRVAGWGTLTVAVIGLVGALFIPMAYCRYGCPTGALLNFLWVRGNSDKFNRRDGVALGFVLLTVSLRMVV